jgi:hypothetical protein
MKISWHCAAWIVLASLAQGPIAFAHWPGHQMAQGTDWRFLNELKKELKA